MTATLDSFPVPAAVNSTARVGGVQDGVDATFTVPLLLAAALARSAHTGSQAIATVTGLQAALDAKATTAGLAAAVAALTRAIGVEVAAPGGVDDTALVTAARAAAGVGGTVIFPASSTAYVVTGLAASVAGQHWVIQPGATVKTKTGANTPTIDVTANGVTIDGGGTIDGNRANQTSTTLGHAGTGDTACVRAISRTDVTVRGLWLKDGGTQAVFADACTRPTIDGNRITGCGPTGNVKAITVFDAVSSTVDLRITDNHIDGTAQPNGCIGVTVFNARSVKRLHITGNTCLPGDASATPTLGIELFTTGTAVISDASVSDNIVVGPTGVVGSDQVFGISVGGSTSSTTDGENTIAVTGNTVRNCPVMAIEVIGRGVTVSANTIIGSGPIAVTAVEVPDGITGVSVIGNSITDGTDVNHAINLDGGTYGIFGLVVMGNTIRNPAGTGILTQGLISGATIVGNPIISENGAAVSLTGTLTDSVISANIIDLTGSGATADGILIGSTSVARLVIGSNVIKGAGRSGIHGNSSTVDITVTGNQITDCQDGLKCNAAQTTWNVTGNTIAHNDDRGLIFVTASTDLAIASNAIFDNPGGDYYTTGSTFLTHVINGAGG